MTDNAALNHLQQGFVLLHQKKAICGVTKILHVPINSNNVLSSMSLLVQSFVKYAAFHKYQSQHLTKYHRSPQRLNQVLMTAPRALR